MSARHPVVEAGPGTVRELAGAEPAFVDAEMVAAALDGIDDPVALVDARPVCVAALWRDVLESIGGPRCRRLTVVHPSWWAATRVERVGAAAHAVADQAVLRPRSWLLARATPAGAPPAAVVVEIAARIVVVTGIAVVAEPRRGEPPAVAEAVIRVIAAMPADAPVVIDAPAGIDGAGGLAATIADGLRCGGDRVVVIVDDARLRRLAAAGVAADDECAPPAGPARRRRWAVPVLAALGAAAVWANPFERGETPAADRMPTTFLVDGRIAVEVPAQWPTQRVTAGPGSARVQVVSPSDPQVVLHLTQSPVADPTLSGVAESLKRAMDGEPPGVFVDFNPSGSSAGRAAVTYREVRAGHDIRWAVVVDRAVRIAVGCQSRPGGQNAIREVCDRAVRSAHVLD